MNRQRGLRWFVAAALVVGAVAASPAPAFAAEADVQATCNLQVNTPTRYGAYVYTSGQVSGCSAEATVVLQRERWYGWEDLRSIIAYPNEGLAFIDYKCTGTGTHTYRTWISNNFTGKASGTMRTSC